ncbi:hypothetical protein DPMN_031260 [Dreissena polymorpha]|uniref:Uncharacterized protein n=1 Tax=Dreissena polymorpha TaxID=45954 RepID=A0A9D4M4A0_DREPO|nr:hypothetical protein DPMN_031260 [Dreissena polymorpha]
MASPDPEISFVSHPSETATIDKINGNESLSSQNYESADDRRHVRFGESSDSRNNAHPHNLRVLIVPTTAPNIRALAKEILTPSIQTDHSEQSLLNPIHMTGQTALNSTNLIFAIARNCPTGTKGRVSLCLLRVYAVRRENFI